MPPAVVSREGYNIIYAGSLLQVYNNEETSDKQKTKGVLFFFLMAPWRSYILEKCQCQKRQRKAGKWSRFKAAEETWQLNTVA